MNELDQEEFKPSVPFWIYVLLVCMMGYLGFAARALFARGWENYRLSESALSASELQNFNWLIIPAMFPGVLFATCALMSAFLMMRHILDRRGSIVLDDEGIRIVNWRNRHKYLPWTSIQKVRVVTCGGLFQPRPLISIKADRHTEKIPAFIPTEARTRLLEEIISRAGLRESHHSWFVSTYKRAPAEGQQLRNTELLT